MMITLSKLGKGVKEVTCKEIKTNSGSMLIVELIIDVADAMGANVTNTMCEAVAPLIEKLSGGRTLLRILSNYSTKRMVTATGTFEGVFDPVQVDHSTAGLLVGGKHWNGVGWYVGAVTNGS